MKTALTNGTDWRRIGKSKPRCIVIGANNGVGGSYGGSPADTVKPLNTYPQAYGGDVDEENRMEQGQYVTPGAEYMAMPENKTEAAVPMGTPDVKSITGIERDVDVKEMETSTITTQSKASRYGTISRTGAGRSTDDKTVRSGNAESRRRGRDLHGGMELLGVDFLLDIVENTEGSEEHDITMRKLSIHELMRTSRISEVDSNVLKYYCMDEDGIYGRDVQCEAMKELATRTRQTASSS